MARFKLGELKGAGGKPTLKFSEWVGSLRKEKKTPEGRYLITLILLPSRYPSGAIIFDTGDARIKKTVDGEILKQMLKSFKFRKEQDREGLKLYLIFDKTGEYYVEGEDAGGIAKYEWRPNYGWRFVEVLEEEEEEDIDF